MSKVVANSTPLINLAKIGRFELLQALFGQIIIPPSVWDELVVRGADKVGSKEVGRANWIEVRRPSESALLRLLSASLDRGEAEAIALAEQLGADLVLLDEFQGRQVATQLGLKVRGTLGLLAEGFRRTLIKDIKSELDNLVSKGTWIAPELVDQILRSLGLK